MVYAVIDTNVFVSALLTKTRDAATVQVFNAIADGRITPLYHKDILKEYEEVLSRPKFKFSYSVVKTVLDSIVECGVEVFPKPTGEILVDLDDLVFYYLVTGNKKHYPVRDFIVTPAEMMDILRDNLN